jgi:hypothetical protein
MSIPVNSKKESKMARVNTLGETVHFMLVSLRMGLNTGKEGGKVVKAPKRINMMVIIAMIKSRDMAYLFGLVATFTRESTKTMKEMAMER